ncbi:MAG: ABC transporter permease [Acidimicrobiales bacterium]
MAETAGGERTWSTRLLDTATGPVTVSIAVALVAGTAIIAVTGEDPATAFEAMVEGALTGSGLRNTVNRLVPIVGMGLALAIPFRAGVINLGGEGQMVFGALAGTLVAIYVPGPGWAVVPVALAAGAAAGAVWGLLPAVGHVRFGLPVLISSLLLNYPARAVTGYLVRFPFADPTVTSSSTVVIPEGHRLVDLPGGVSPGLIVVLAAAAAIAVFNRRTVAGYESEVVGLNARFARYGGVDVSAHTVGAMVASGAIAGIIGTQLILGETFRFLDGDLVATGFAWTGLLVTLLARHRPVGVLAAGAFFAALQIGGLAMQRSVNVPWQLAQVLQAVVIIALASRLTMRWLRRRSTPAEEPPAAPAVPDLEAAGVGEV